MTVTTLKGMLQMLGLAAYERPLAGEHVEVFLVGVNTVVALAGGFLQDFSPLKGFDGLDHRGLVDAQQLDRHGHGHDRVRG